MAVYQLPLDGMFTCSGEITKYKLCLANYNWTSNISVTLVRFREVQIQNQTVASTGVSHVQLVVTADSPARLRFLGVLRKKNHNAKLTFGCNDFLGCTAPSRLANVVTNDNILYVHACSISYKRLQDCTSTGGTILKWRGSDERRWLAVGAWQRKTMISGGSSWLTLSTGNTSATFVHRDIMVFLCHAPTASHLLSSLPRSSLASVFSYCLV